MAPAVPGHVVANVCTAMVPVPAVETEEADHPARLLEGNGPAQAPFGDEFLVQLTNQIFGLADALEDWAVKMLNVGIAAKDEHVGCIGQTNLAQNQPRRR